MVLTNKILAIGKLLISVLTIMSALYTVSAGHPKDAVDAGEPLRLKYLPPGYPIQPGHIPLVAYNEGPSILGSHTKEVEEISVILSGDLL